MSESKRKIFTGEQNAKVALEAVKGTKTIYEIAQEYGVHPTQVAQWKKELLTNAGSLFEGKRGSKPVNAHNNPLIWLPIIGVHLLFFSGLTLLNRLHNVDWQYLRCSSIYIIPPAIIGVFGLVNLPVLWLNSFIYSVTLFYGFTWLFNRGIESQHVWADKGYTALGNR